MTGVIRATALLTVLCWKTAETGRTFGMATMTILSRHEDNRMGAGESISQVNSFACRDKRHLCRKSDSGERTPMAFLNQQRILRSRRSSNL